MPKAIPQMQKSRLGKRLLKYLERVTRFELVTSTLARSRSDTSSLISGFISVGWRSPNCWHIKAGYLFLPRAFYFTFCV